MNKQIVVVTAGDPSLEKTREYLTVLTKKCAYAGIAFPFSDPIAGDEAAEAANLRSLARGTTTDKIFAMLEEAGLERLVALSYVNPIFVYGCDRFFSRCKRGGVYGIIIPDLPFEERAEVAEFAKRYGIRLITVVAPNSGGRIEMLARQAEGFIYIAPSQAKGEKEPNELTADEITARIRKVTQVPVYVAASAVQQRETATADGFLYIGERIEKLISR